MHIVFATEVNLADWGGWTFMDTLNKEEGENENVGCIDAKKGLIVS